MSLRAVPNPDSLIACVLAAGEAQDRMAVLRPPPPPIPRPSYADMSPAEIVEARGIAQKTRMNFHDAAGVVRRSRR